MTQRELKTLRIANSMFGIAACIVLLSGVINIIYYGKSTEFYMTNYLFHIKMTMFLLVVLLSIYPTALFHKWKKQYQTIHTVTLNPKQYRTIVLIMRIELTLLILMPLLASLISNDIPLKP